MFRPQTILHPTDFSACSQFAFTIAVDLARQNQARLIVLHVAAIPGPEQVSYREALTKPEPETYHNELLGHMKAAVPPEDRDLPITFLVVEGEPVAEIERTARTHDCDLIVMGTHGRVGLDHLLMGSVAAQVVRRASCPVLTARHRPSSGG